MGSHIDAQVTLANASHDFPLDDPERPWLEASLRNHPDSSYWREQVQAHLQQARTTGWVKYENYARGAGRDPLRLSTFAQMASAAHTPATITVRLRAGVDALSALSDLGLGLVHVRAIEPARTSGGIHIYRTSPGLAVADLLDSVNAHPAVRYAEPDFLIEPMASRRDGGAASAIATVPNEPLVGADAWWLTQVNAYEAWDYATDARAIGPILTLDSGISRTHEDLQGNFWINPGEIAGNGIDDDNNGYIDDINGITDTPSTNHGTSVAGTLCARGNNGIGYTGIAWRCNLMDGNPGGSWDSVASAMGALNYAVAKGSRLSNHSWGGPTYSQALKDVITQVAADDHLLVVAAHNYGRNIDNEPIYPAAYDNANVLTIAATNVAGDRRSYSNWGSDAVDLAAPTEFDTTELAGGYAKFAGTSQSTPMVTAAVALAWSQVPQWTFTEIKQLVLDTVRPVGSWAGLTRSGGIVDMRAMMEGLDDGSGPLRLSIRDVSVSEVQATAPVSVRLSRSAADPVTVTFFTRTVAGSAQPGRDFYGMTTTVTFAPGEVVKSVAVTIIDDGEVESSERFEARLTSAAGAIIADPVARVTIEDNDGAGTPKLSVSDQTFSENVGTAAVQVSLSPAATVPVSVVAFTRFDGNATPGVDLYGATSTLNFAPGETNKTFDLTVLNDNEAEPSETFDVRLVSATGASIASNRARITLTDSGGGTQSAFSIDSVSVNEDDGTATLTVSLSSAADASVTVFTRADGAARGGTDFYGFTKILSFQSGGPTSQAVTVTVLDDQQAESTERLSVRLTSPSGAVIASGVGEVTILDND